MSGKHYKKSEASSVAGKAALSGLALTGAGMWFSSTAEAATDDQWDRVAACESSNNWHINTGNGYQGGLQFAPSTWLGHGGGQFASAANLATREQQIAIAERVLASQGRGAWPVCGRGLGAATPRQISPAPHAPEVVQPHTAPSVGVAVSFVEKDVLTDTITPALVKSSTPAPVVTQADFVMIADNLQILQANDLRAPAPFEEPAPLEVSDVDISDDSSVESSDDSAPDAAPAVDATNVDPASDVESEPEFEPALDDTADPLGEFVLAAENRGIAV